jgi:hypothetical protein
MGLGVPREVQQLVCVCANEFGGATDCGEYREVVGAIEPTSDFGSPMI